MTPRQRILIGALLFLIVVGRGIDYYVESQVSLQWLSSNQVNVVEAKNVDDEEIVEKESAKTDEEAQHPDDCSLIHVNTATIDELQELPGIGPAFARNIIEERSIELFVNFLDLLKVRGIGEKRLATIKPLICLEVITIDE